MLKVMTGMTSKFETAIIDRISPTAMHAPGNPDLDEMLEALGRPQSHSIDHLVDVQYNYCPECHTPMEQASNEYCCKYCGLTCHNELDTSKVSSGAARGTIRVGNGSVYYFNGEYPKTQHKMIITQLNRLQANHRDIVIPPAVLATVAEKYNTIQKHTIEVDYDADGNLIEKKFVHRGNVKDEVLATILYYECMSAGLIKDKCEIAKFMNLPADGFARGEDIVRTLVENGDIVLDMDSESPEAYMDRYMCALHITNVKYCEFVVALVNASEKHHIGVSSQLSSKVVGAIWIVISKCHLPITWEALEKATNNTKKNTFIKFSKVIYSNMRLFAPVFIKYGIPVK